MKSLHKGHSKPSYATESLKNAEMPLLFNLSWPKPWRDVEWSHPAHSTIDWKMQFQRRWNVDSDPSAVRRTHCRGCTALQHLGWNSELFQHRKKNKSNCRTSIFDIYILISNLLFFLEILIGGYF